MRRLCCLPMACCHSKSAPAHLSPCLTMPLPGPGPAAAAAAAAAGRCPFPPLTGWAGRASTAARPPRAGPWGR